MYKYRPPPDNCTLFRVKGVGACDNELVDMFNIESSCVSSHQGVSTGSHSVPTLGSKQAQRLFSQCQQIQLNLKHFLPTIA